MSEPSPENLQRLADAVTGDLLDAGAVIGAGWLAFERQVLSPQAGEAQRREMRLAFFAGAQHLFASVMRGLDPEAEPTMRDIERMSKLADELQRFASQFMRGYYDG
ncbi:MAG TPA: hypothetical protein VF151_10960 [Gemmatimonadales bacterium]